jgi:Predicted transcriptional regulators
MKVDVWPIGDVKLYAKNPRSNDNAVEAVAESIRQFGFRQPLVVDTDGVIVVGHTRHKAALLLGLETVPVHVADTLTPEQARAYRLADNKTAEIAAWDAELLDVEIHDLAACGMDLNVFGFDVVTDSVVAGDEFSLPESDKPQFKVMTLTFSEDQFETVKAVLAQFETGTPFPHAYGNTNRKSNAIFEAIHEWAELKKLI